APSRSLGHPRGGGLRDPALWYCMVEAGAPAAISTREPAAVPHWQEGRPGYRRKEVCLMGFGEILAFWLTLGLLVWLIDVLMWWLR
ncbi:MAG TPA: hypothetical protein VKJ47_09120, partial [Candidatus Binatia bacterium]|nr:hypothetical protein [Candidatus Binatia bacterium]